MDTTKIKVRIGEHEFEAEGPVDLVRDQFQAFRELLSTMPVPTQAPETSLPQQPTHNKELKGDSTHVSLENILHVAGRVVSLTALPVSSTDAALLVMLGHKDLRNNVSVTGQEIGDGLAQSGRQVPRVDRVMEDAIRDAYVLKTGVKRGTRYRLTNQGLTKALNIAKDLIASLP
jgi:hypothetical protein